MGSLCSKEAGASMVDRRARARDLGVIENLIEEKWREVDRDNSGDVSLSELVVLLRKLNVNCTKRRLRAVFTKYDVNGDNKLQRSEFRAFFLEAQSRPLQFVNKLWVQYCDDPDRRTMSTEAFHAFLTREQGEAPLGGIERTREVVAALKGRLRRQATGEAEAGPPASDFERALRHLARMRNRARGEEDLVESVGTVLPLAADGSGAAAAQRQASARARPSEQQQHQQHQQRANPLAGRSGQQAADAAIAGSGGGSQEDADSPGGAGRDVVNDESQRAVAQSLLEEAARTDALSFREFELYLTDTELNGLMQLEHAGRVYQPMDRPLTHYFISSSHNTYLTGDQYIAPASVRAIQRALSLGCRVIELDCYDGRNGGEPVVKHGPVATSMVHFRAAVQAVRDYAFRAENILPSEYPVIITIENHCSSSGQQQQAAILQEELGDSLYVPPQPRPRQLPSPEALRNRILIRDKPKTTWQVEPPAGDAAATAAADPSAIDFAAPDSEEEVEEEEKKQAGASPSTDKPAASKALHPDLLRLCTVLNVKFKSFAKPGVPALDAMGTTSSSFDEDKIKRILTGDKDKGEADGGAPPAAAAAGGGPSLSAQFLSYTQRHLARIYPRGLRVRSTNYDPAPMWAAGCQVVALNFQNLATPVFQNQVFFMQNGGCGFRLKPPRMLATAPAPDADFTATAAPPTMRVTVSVKTGHYLPKPSASRRRGRGEIIDPYVKVFIAGAKADQASHSTPVVPNNGYNPDWCNCSPDESTTTFAFDVRQPEVGTLMLEVLDKDPGLAADDLVAYGGCPLASLATGWRMVPLFDAHSVPIEAASLFVHVAVENLNQ